MKKIIIALVAAAALVFGGCSTSKEISKSPVKTIVLPGADLVSGNGLIRGWGMGKSDSEASAHKKAQINASAALALALTQTLESSTEEYLTDVAKDGNGVSRSLLNDAVKTTVKQVLTGATIIYDTWAKEKDNGQHVNYIVMELKGEDFLQELYKATDKKNTNIDKELLEKIFLKHIEEKGKSNK